MSKSSNSKKITNQELDELKNQLARALADYDNLRKRVEKDKEHFTKIASITLVDKLLPVLDMLKDAQKHLKDSGIEIVISEFEAVLNEEGVVKINTKKGDDFDENLHEVVEVISNKKSEGKILEIVLEGWRIKNGPVIRPTKVKVGKN
jgi:molecular chaperone GrpE